MNIADALVTKMIPDGHQIIKQVSIPCRAFLCESLIEFFKLALLLSSSQFVIYDLLGYITAADNTMHVVSKKYVFSILQ